MNDSDRYVKIVEWSKVDNCYVGSCPGLLHGGCHGDDQKAVFDELCRADGKELPVATAGKDLAGLLRDVA